MVQSRCPSVSFHVKFHIKEPGTPLSADLGDMHGPHPHRCRTAHRPSLRALQIGSPEPPTHRGMEGCGNRATGLEAALESRPLAQGEDPVSRC